MNYKEAVERMKGARNPEAGRLIANNTRLIQRGADFAVRLHDTDVVTLHKSGAYTLNSGGWKTVTTKARINEYAPVQVYSSRGDWSVRAMQEGAQSVPFRDGCRVTAAGRIIGAGSAATVKKTEKLRGQVKAFAAEYTRRLYAGEILTPSGGDCWGCYMVAVNENNGRPEAFRTQNNQHGIFGPDHIREHVRESYYVPSLILRALEAMGASKAAQNDAAYLLKMPGWETAGMYDKAGGFIRFQIQKMLRRYCLRACGLSY